MKAKILKLPDKSKNCRPVAEKLFEKRWLTLLWKAVFICVIGNMCEQ